MMSVQLPERDGPLVLADLLWEADHNYNDAAPPPTSEIEALVARYHQLRMDV